MSHARLAVGLAACLPLACIGCGPPTLRIDHGCVYPLGLDHTLVVARIEPFEVLGADEDAGYGEHLAEALPARIHQEPRCQGTFEDDLAVDLGGRIKVDVTDATGTRTLRLSTDGTEKTAQVSTLVRTAAVDVLLQVLRAGTDEKIVALTARRDYSSLDDPASRGELGLGRADDPANVRPAEDIVKDLLDECAASLGRVLSPVVVEAGVPLRPTDDPAGRRALGAAREGRYERAAELLTEALRDRPDDVDLLFNLAAVQEAAGELEAAMAHYAAAREMAEGGDPGARQGVARVGMVLGVSEVPEIGK